MASSHLHDDDGDNSANDEQQKAQNALIRRHLLRCGCGTKEPEVREASDPDHSAELNQPTTTRSPDPREGWRGVAVRGCRAQATSPEPSALRSQTQTHLSGHLLQVLCRCLDAELHLVEVIVDLLEHEALLLERLARILPDLNGLIHKLQGSWTGEGKGEEDKQKEEKRTADPLWNGRSPFPCLFVPTAAAQYRHNTAILTGKLRPTDKCTPSRARPGARLQASVETLIDLVRQLPTVSHHLLI